MTSALRWAAMRAILMSHNCEGQSHKTVSTDHNFWRERRTEADSNWGPSAYQPNALPLDQTGSQENKWKLPILIRFQLLLLACLVCVDTPEPISDRLEKYIQAIFIYDRLSVYCLKNGVYTEKLRPFCVVLLRAVLEIFTGAWVIGGSFHFTPHFNVHSPNTECEQSWRQSEYVTHTNTFISWRHVNMYWTV